ncbi:STAS domain-containing protein [Streptomyces sp. NPDC006552]|uniref:STAS domain-containing protein n=1 Tax=Streptomyces sp. NPDC006552 TaxID=3157179 RepID=UPI0033B31BE9
MTDRTLTTDHHQHASGAVIVTVTGELDHHTASELTQVVQEISFAPDTPVVIDMTGLTYCDSTGITVLITAHNRAEQARSPLVLAGLNKDLRHVLRIVGLDQIFTFQPTADDAVRSLYTTKE